MIFSSAQVINNSILLKRDTWDDYGFKTTFTATYYENGTPHKLGIVQIADANYDEGPTELPPTFNELTENFFSLGSPEYYKNLYKILNHNRAIKVLNMLNDMAFNTDIYFKYCEHRATRDSLLRGSSSTFLFRELKPLAEHKAVPTAFNYSYILNEQNNTILDFDVDPDSKPASNIHVLIGENGVGKTKCLEKMFSAFVNGDRSFYPRIDQNNAVLSTAIFVSFSAFDSGDMLRVIENNQNNSVDENKPEHKVIGLKKTVGNNIENKTVDNLKDDLSCAIEKLCNKKRTYLWAETIKMLDAINSFNGVSMQEASLKNIEDTSYTNIENNPHDFIINCVNFFAELSSGHKIVLLTLAQLIAYVDQQTVVFMDEPETHLHPPLVAIFLESLKKILNVINGVAIIATHSPVILQEVPTNCVYRINRRNSSLSAKRPGIQTYGENIGTITRDIFGHELRSSGYFKKMEEEAKSRQSFEHIMASYNYSIGFEAQDLLRMFIYEEEERKNAENQ
ncbi:AAA family ATPase [Butyrivibrio sp. AC2005]|uniref:AAA family ATPase n=1 Tax=Butyrivibrio sp. AC2005 TaxID=1280672 RepID=UPI00042903AB|nr:AAA family ATPase [Butyrivibrio sp. AC2005]